MSRKEQALLTKKTLFDTAIKLINEKGYDNVTISEICKESKVAKGTFYVHFESKEDIIKENYYSNMSDYVLKDYDQFLLDEYKNYISENNDKSVKEKIIYFLRSELIFAQHKGYELTSRVFLTNLSQSIAGKNNHFVEREFADVLRKLISEGMDKKIFKNNKGVEEYLLYIESFSRGIFISWCLSKGEFDVAQIGEKFIREMIENL